MKFVSRINCEQAYWSKPRCSGCRIHTLSASWRRGVAFFSFGTRNAGWGSAWHLSFAWSWGAEGYL